MAAWSVGHAGNRDGPETGERRALPPELTHVLVQFSIALHKTGTYPPAHPALEGAVRALTLRLSPVLASRGSLRVGVSRTSLVVDAGATDPTHPVLRSLAETLHTHQIAALRFLPGLTPVEVTGFLETVSADTRRATALGLQSPEALRRWPHIEIDPLELDRLRITEDGTRSNLENLWLSLAAAALRQDSAGMPETVDLEAVTDAIRANLGDESYDQTIVEYMHQLGRELIVAGPAAAGVGGALGRVLTGLGDEALARLLSLGGDLAQRKRLVVSLAPSLPANAILTLAKAASDASKRVVSDTLLRLFAKMADNAGPESGTISANADAALRDGLQQLVEGWDLEDPNPERYHELLQDIGARRREADGETDDPAQPDPFRFVNVALSCGAIAPPVLRAVDSILAADRFGDLVRCLVTARPSPANTAVRRHLTAPENLRKLLESRVSRDHLDQVLEWAGVDAAPALLDALERSESRAARRQILARLSAFGADVGQLAVERLESGPWYVMRNMLVLLNEIEPLPENFTIAPYLAHGDPRVRREAVRLGLSRPDWRDSTILAGLDDPDLRVLRLVLAAAIEGCPPGVTAPTIRRLEAGPLEAQIKVMAFQVLGYAGNAEARDWLTRKVLARRRWFRRRRLAQKTPEMLAALDQLATRWPKNRTVAPVLRLARASTDPEIRAAVATRGGGVG